MIRHVATVAFLAAASLASQAGAQEHAGHSPYAGQESRALKSLSDDDIAELKRGGGWGLAKAAELNGMPGPAHLLELKDKIPLDTAQVAKIEEIFATMKAAAIVEGEKLIAHETELERQFRDRTITPESLRTLVGRIEQSRGALRTIHLETHLSTPALLSQEQIDRYNALRGYGASNPCATVPEGHDPAMWRKHNGCD